MKERTCRIVTVPFYDHSTMEKQLRKMASKGWMLDKIGFLFWFFHRIEPCVYDFTITYSARASNYVSLPSEGQLTFSDFCNRTGWTMAASNRYMQVFFNRNCNPVPIHTDPSFEVSSIHKAVKMSFLPVQFVLFLLAMFNVAIFCMRFLSNPQMLLSNGSAFSTGLAWTVVLVLALYETISYYRWHGSAVKAAERGVFLETPNHSIIQITGAVIALSGFMYWLVLSILTCDVLMIFLLLVAPLYSITMYCLFNYIRVTLIKKEASATITMLSSILFTFAFAFCTMFLVYKIAVYITK